MAALFGPSADSVAEGPPLTNTPSLVFQTEGHPKGLGRNRLMQSFQRMSSSPTIGRLVRPPSGLSYRGIGKGSVSCVTLNSDQSPYGQGYGSSSDSQFYSGYSTAPESHIGTPGVHTPLIGSSTKLHYLASDGRWMEYKPVAALSIEEDYFSRPLTEAVPARKRKENFDFWGEMPSELKMHILCFLKPRDIIRCSAVSKSWHEMCFDGQLWAKLDTTEYYRDIPAEGLIRLISSAGSFAKDLNLRGCAQLWENWRRFGLPDACRNLEHLSLQDCRLDRNSMHTLLYQNTHLVHLNLTGLTDVNNATMRILSKNCPKLEVLNVMWCSNVDTQGLRQVIESCENLIDLRAGELKGLEDKEFMLELFNNNRLERLVIPNCEELTDETLSVLFEGTHAELDYITGRRIVAPRVLKHLDISRSRHITDEGLKSLVNNVPCLEGLQLTKCKALTDASVQALIASTPKLTHLDIEEVELLTNSTLQELAKSACKDTLQHLSISYCENLGDIGMLPVIKACADIRSLDMDNTRISDLVLAEAAAMVRQRSTRSPPVPLQRAVTWDGSVISRHGHASFPHTSGPARPKVGLRMSVYDCQNVTWTGIREVLSRNAEIRRPTPFGISLRNIPTPSSPESSHSSSAASSTYDLAEAHTGELFATLSSNIDSLPQMIPQLTPSHPTQIISLKVFYGYQPTVTEHTRRVLRGDFAAASRLERKWAEYMVATEEAGAALGVGNGNGTGNGNAGLAGLGMAGNRRRRRRVREAQMMHADEEEGGVGGTGIGRRRRARSGGGCAVM